MAKQRTTRARSGARGASAEPVAGNGHAQAHPLRVPVELPATEGRRRVAIERVRPEIDAGRFPVKRVVGDALVVEADVFTDGHDLVEARLAYRPVGETVWVEQRMHACGNDRFLGEFPLTQLGRWQYTVVAWIDRFGSWRRDFEKRVIAGHDVAVDLRVGATIVEQAAQHASERLATSLRAAAATLRGGGDVAIELALGDELQLLIEDHPDRTHETHYERVLQVVVDRERARFSSWYECFPRSSAEAPDPDGTPVHGTFADLEQRLRGIAAMGFDVLYLPPVHPIGEVNRKGPNNSVDAGPDDPGSPWAIGSREGGHTAIHSRLGTLDDFDRLRDHATELGLELAMDLAYQCAPDHPWVTEHPEFFRRRPDGTIQYAENPPKQYQDIYPIDFETEAWRELWQALKGVVDFWMARGIRIFRVDNPHTKAFPFWEWMIGAVTAEHPDVIFLSEAFTRPRVMHRLAKLGFTQSYTYFTWRTTKWELEEYVRELAHGEGSEYLRPNFWPNTPDILTEQLQYGGRAAFVSRLVLAATLSSNYGIYGPTFELMEHEAVRPGSEEYRDSEKYQLRHWQLDRPDSLAELITRVNRARHAHPALQRTDNVRFLATTNDQILACLKQDPDSDDAVLVVVNVDAYWKQTGFLDLPLDELGLEAGRPFLVRDLVGGADYVWNGERNYVELDPHVLPAHIFELRRRMRSERDFDYYF